MKLTEELKRKVREYYSSKSKEELEWRFKKFESEYYPQNTLNGLLSNMSASSLESRISPIINLYLCGAPSDFGYRPNVAWTDAEDKVLEKIDKLTKDMTEHLVHEITKWVEDGMPKGDW